jgi:soluble lytic murein transglycosylase-like protein
MDGVRLMVAALSLVAPPAARAADVSRWRPQIELASARCGIPVPWIERVMRAESGGRITRNRRPIRSIKGAIGLMQLMPGTWTEMRDRLGLGADPDEPHDNILAGTCYLRLMYDRFGYPGLFAAYNAGPRRYAAYLANRQPLPGETLAYLRAVGGGAVPAAATPASTHSPTLFVVHREVAVEEAPQAKPIAPTSLFAIRNDAP